MGNRESQERAVTEAEIAINQRHGNGILEGIHSRSEAKRHCGGDYASEMRPGNNLLEVRSCRITLSLMNCDEREAVQTEEAEIVVQEQS